MEVKPPNDEPKPEYPDIEEASKDIELVKKAIPKKWKKVFIAGVVSTCIIGGLSYYGYHKYTENVINQGKNKYSEALESMSPQGVINVPYGNVGDMIPAQTVINSWNENCKNPNVTVQYKNMPYQDGQKMITPDLQQQTGNISGMTYNEYEKGIKRPYNKINRMAAYKIEKFEFDKNGEPKLIYYYEDKSASY